MLPSSNTHQSEHGLRREYNAWAINGFLGILLLLILGAGGLTLVIQVVWSLVRLPQVGQIDFVSLGIGGLLLLATSILTTGFVVIGPGTARVLVFFGSYFGTLRQEGFFLTMPLTQKRLVNLRIHNHEVTKIKVNDHNGTPIEIGAVVVMQVRNPAQATLDVEDWKGFVASQCETALRSLSGRFPYEPYQPGGSSLHGSPDQVAASLQEEVQARVIVAGMAILEARLSHLAYAPEIAQAMLRRQQAEAVVAARGRIVEGAVGMVDMALKGLCEKGVVLDEERKAAMVNNLLVALVSESSAQPVLNTSSLY